ncbi:small GTP-binding domain protein, partial [Chlamydia psittaci 06-1683]
KSLSL